MRGRSSGATTRPVLAADMVRTRAVVNCFTEIGEAAARLTPRPRPRRTGAVAADRRDAEHRRPPLLGHRSGGTRQDGAGRLACTHRRAGKCAGLVARESANDAVDPPRRAHVPDPDHPARPPHVPSAPSSRRAKCSPQAAAAQGMTSCRATAFGGRADSCVLPTLPPRPNLISPGILFFRSRVTPPHFRPIPRKRRHSCRRGRRKLWHGERSGGLLGLFHLPRTQLSARTPRAVAREGSRVRLGVCHLPGPPKAARAKRPSWGRIRSVHVARGSRLSLRRLMRIKGTDCGTFSARPSARRDRSTAPSGRA
ncbi:hypothetical protein BH11PLA1_BH11PLA1_05880 [soil metagenome]